METIDLTSFEKALNSLLEVIEIYKKNPSDLITRDSMIQRFEYTYSIYLKMIKRFLFFLVFPTEIFKKKSSNYMFVDATFQANLFYHLFLSL